MAENNPLAGRLPSEPYVALRQLDRLVGTWEVSGSFFQGTISFEWMEGGFFLVQRVDGRAGGRTIRGVEYIGYDEDTQTLRSHYMDIHGATFTYTWAVDGDAIRTWFGDKGSDNFFQGRFSEDGRAYSGSWQWPGGGYTAMMTRTD
jgi:hypothetical protein